MLGQPPSLDGPAVMDWLFLPLIFVAIAIGWTLGRRERKRSRYYEMGLRHLLNDEPDEAVATLVTELDVDTDNIDTHLALGGLLRRRGELEKAVFVHENILSRARLDRSTRHEVQIELARDYLQAGLLDRAESMSVALAQENPEYRSESLKVTLQVYEQERDWHRAIEIAKQITGADSGPRVERAISHYWCELAELSLAGHDLPAAAAHLTEAIGHFAQNARASLLQGAVALESGQNAAAIGYLERVLEQDSGYVGESLPLLEQAHDLDKDPALYRAYLERCLDQAPLTSVVLALGRVIQASEGDEALGRFIANQMRNNPTLRGFIELIDLNIAESEGAMKQHLGLLRRFTESLIVDKASYRCGECGFEGKRMRWHCPSCRNWASIRPILGLEGE